jgi:hypothetical protein
LDNVTPDRPANAASLMAAIVAVEGSARHSYLRYLLGRQPSRRDLADAVHALCLVYGTKPGAIDIAAAQRAQPDAAPWLTAVAAGFAGERAALVRLAAAVGPLPSTPGQAAFEAAVAGVNHALSMLATSGRAGCATGAVAALVGDWHVIRAILVAAAVDCGVALPDTVLPPVAVTTAAITMLGKSPASERAMAFGARQLLAQHHGLWTLMQARATARDRLYPNRNDYSLQVPAGVPS